MSLRYFPIVIFLLIFCGAGSSYARWDLVAQFNFERASSGFFWDEQSGLIGFGNGATGSNVTARIRKTTDGGKTWTISFVPFARGRVTSIFMKDRLVGYASIYPSSNPRNFTIWKTTDGGVNWLDNTFGNSAVTPCVYATSKALIRTAWFDGNIGGFSVNDGRSYTPRFSNIDGERSNGIDFADDQFGVVTMGPPNPPLLTNTPWYSQNGGLNWGAGTPMPEAWSVYAVKGTKTFFTMPEGVRGSYNLSLYRSDDGGMNWLSGFTFPPPTRFTGHIAGAVNTLYIQTETGITGIIDQGLFRSDDLGVSWKNIGGPSNNRDTRFVVTGCAGEVVYAFDNLGGVWKTSDGGDGGKILALGADSVFISGFCELAVRGYIHLTNHNCFDYIVDSVSFFPDPYKEFSLDTVNCKFNLRAELDFGIPVKFQTDSSVTRTTKIIIHGNYNGIPFDTTIDLIASNKILAGPVLGLAPDSVSISGDCLPALGSIGLLNYNCDSVVIDNISVSPDLYSEFSFDTLKTNPEILFNDTIAIPIHFQSDSDVTRMTTFHILAHSNNRIIDTTIIVRAQHATISGPIMSLAQDSIYMETRYCQPLRRYIIFSNVNCNSLIIDSVIFSPQYPELTIDTSGKDLFLPKFSSVGIPVYFRTDSNITRRTTMRIAGHSYGRTIDTTIIIVARHSTAPEPYLPVLKKTKVGDTLLVPIFLKPTADDFAIRHYSFHLSYDGDILTPADGIYQTGNTLSFSGKVTVGNPEPGGILITVDFLQPITQDSDLTLPLIYLQMRVTLSKNLSCSMLLDTFSISSIGPLPLCTIPVTEFIVDPQCGDRILWKYMLNKKIPDILSVRPNPNSGGEIEADIEVPQQSNLSAELIDAMGKQVLNIFSDKEFAGGKHTLKINTSTLMSGKYILRIHTPEGGVIQYEIVVVQ